MTAPESSFTWDDVQKAIADAQTETRDLVTRELTEKHTGEMDALRAQLAGNQVVSPIPEHSAGPGTEVRETWSLAEQEAARAAAWAAKEVVKTIL